MYDDKDEKQTRLQYFKVDANSQIQLIYPLVVPKMQQLKIIEQIQLQGKILSESTGQQIRMKQFSNQTKEVANVFQDLTHLKKILNFDKDTRDYSQCNFTYGEDENHQFLCIHDS